MEFKNTYTFKGFNDTHNVRFNITQHNHSYTLHICIYENTTLVEKIDNIELICFPNNVFRTKEFGTKTTYFYDKYSICTIRVMLKFKNNNISPVSCLYLTCHHCDTHAQRIFALNMDSIETYGVIQKQEI